jgi:hypothetical protein
MLDLKTIDADLRLVTRAWRVARQLGYTPSTAHIDDLLAERAEITCFRDFWAGIGGVASPLFEQTDRKICNGRQVRDQ